MRQAARNFILESGSNHRYWGEDYLAAEGSRFQEIAITTGAPGFQADASAAERPTERSVDPVRLANFTQRIKEEQSLGRGVLAAGMAALFGAILWAVITLVTEYQIGWMAIGVGFLVGFANRYFGKGVDQVFGVVGAVLALLGCVGGNVLWLAGEVSVLEAVPFLDVLYFFALSPGVVIELLGMTFAPIDLFFYGLAAYEGYKFSLRGISKQEMKALMVEKPQLP